jgi:hypothetical protein
MAAIVVFVPLDDAQLCAVGAQYDKAGVLVGETDTRVYVGEEREKGDNRIISVPNSQVEAVFIGPEAYGLLCDEPQSRGGGKGSHQTCLSPPTDPLDSTEAGRFGMLSPRGTVRFTHPTRVLPGFQIPSRIVVCTPKHV